MPTPAWPSTLPQYLLTRNYKETAPTLAIRTQMDAGPAKMRRRFTANARPISGMLLLNEYQLAVLDEFFLNDCQGGAQSFCWTMQRRLSDSDSSADSNAPLDSDAPVPSFPPMTFRFVKPPAYADSGDGKNYEVTLSLEILP